MDRQQIGVKLAMDGLKFKCQISTFEDRLIFQKAIYLAQSAGINLGYYYHWYLYGPYCSSLTRDAYTIAEEVAQDIDDCRTWTLDDDSISELKKLQGLFGEEKGVSLSRRLELLASIHFLVTRKQVSRNDAEQITATLKRFNKDFGEDEVAGAIKDLIRYGLLEA